MIEPSPQQAAEAVKSYLQRFKQPPIKDTIVLSYHDVFNTSCFTFRYCARIAKEHSIRIIAVDYDFNWN